MYVCLFDSLKYIFLNPFDASIYTYILKDGWGGFVVVVCLLLCTKDQPYIGTLWSDNN